MTKVLMISSDIKILEEESSVRTRMIEYGKLFDELHIVVFARSGFQFPVAKIELAKNTFAYPTRSFSKLLHVRNAIKIGAVIVSDWDIYGSVITAQDPFETGLAGRKLSRRSGIPLHIQIHTDMNSPYFVRSSFLNLVRLFLARKNLKVAAAIRTVSERIKRSLKDERASVLPIYTDIVAIKQSPVPVGFKTAQAKFERTILVASRLTKEKGVHDAVRAFKDISIRHPETGLLIIGDGPEKERLKLKIKNLKLEERVAFLPWMDHARLISYMKTCDVFLSTSLYEGYGLSMLEAHSAGATLAVTDAGIAPLLAHEKNLASPRNIKSISSALENALSGSFKNKDYTYPYPSKEIYLEAFKKDIERALA